MPRGRLRESGDANSTVERYGSRQRALRRAMWEPDSRLMPV